MVLLERWYYLVFAICNRNGSKPFFSLYHDTSLIRFSIFVPHSVCIIHLEEFLKREMNVQCRIKIGILENELKYVEETKPKH